MNAPGFICPPAAWEEVRRYAGHNVSGMKWTLEMKVADLRFCEDAVLFRLPIDGKVRRTLPPDRELAKVWGCSHTTVRRLKDQRTEVWASPLGDRPAAPRITPQGGTLAAQRRAERDAAQADAEPPAAAESHVPSESADVPPVFREGYSEGGQSGENVPPVFRDVPPVFRSCASTSARSDIRRTDIQGGGVEREPWKGSAVPRKDRACRSGEKGSLSSSTPDSSPPSQQPPPEHPYDPAELLEALGEGASIITGRAWMPEGDPAGRAHTPASLRHGREGVPLYELLKARGWPALDIWLTQLDTVARAARECPHPMFSNDIRGEGWASKSDTSRMLRTICDLGRWAARLDRAEEWLAELEVVEQLEADADDGKVVQLAVARSERAPLEKRSAAQIIAAPLPDERNFLGLFTPAAIANAADPLTFLTCRGDLTDEALAALTTLELSHART